MLKLATRNDSFLGTLVWEHTEHIPRSKYMYVTCSLLLKQILSMEYSSTSSMAMSVLLP